jgi:hypothetical protein
LGFCSSQKIARATRTRAKVVDIKSPGFHAEGSTYPSRAHFPSILGAYRPFGLPLYPTGKTVAEVDDRKKHGDDAFDLAGGHTKQSDGEPRQRGIDGPLPSLRNPVSAGCGWSVAVTFIPGARQTMDLKELGQLFPSGDSWREGVTALQKKYDNIPL